MPVYLKNCSFAIEQKRKDVYEFVNVMTKQYGASKLIYARFHFDLTADRLQHTNFVL